MAFFTRFGRAEGWLRPLCFWAIVACFLGIVFGITYAWGRGKGLKVAEGAVELRDVTPWSGNASFAFVERSDGVIERVFDYPTAPADADVDIRPGDTGVGESGGPEPERAAIFGSSSKEEEEEKEGEEEEVAKAREQERDRLERLAEMGYLGGDVRASAKPHGIDIGAYDENAARAILEELRRTGRVASVEEVIDESGQVKYRVRAGAAGDEEEAARLRSELEQDGIGGGGQRPSKASSPTEPARVSEISSPEPAPAGAGKSTEPPSAPPTSPSGASSGGTKTSEAKRPIGEL